eukprot:scaffold18116_cov123-Isochrysis_galbana.AAC.4
MCLGTLGVISTTTTSSHVGFGAAANPAVGCGMYVGWWDLPACSGRTTPTATAYSYRATATAAVLEIPPRDDF